MRRTTHASKAAEKAWCFPVVPYPSPDEKDDLRAINMTDNPQTHHAGQPSMIKEEHKDDQNPIKEEHKDDPNLSKAFFWYLIVLAWMFYLALVVTFFILVLIGSLPE